MELLDVDCPFRILPGVVRSQAPSLPGPDKGRHLPAGCRAGRGNLYVSHVLRGRDLLIDMLLSRDHLVVTSECESDAKSMKSWRDDMFIIAFVAVAGLSTAAAGSPNEKWQHCFGTLGCSRGRESVLHETPTWCLGAVAVCTLLEFDSVFTCAIGQMRPLPVFRGLFGMPVGLPPDHDRDAIF